MISDIYHPCIIIVGGSPQKREAKAEEQSGLKPGNEANNPDLRVLEAETSIGIAEVRQLQNFLHLRPYRQRQKTALIREAQNLTPEAQNALLKTLEEPPEHSLIILTLPDLSALLPTIISRCRVMQLAWQPQISLDPERLKKTTALWEKLLTTSIGERFVMLERLNIYKNRQEAAVWLDELTAAVRDQLLKKCQEKNGSTQSLLLVLAQIKRTQKYLSANCNLRLAIEAFLSRLPEESQG